MHGGGGGVELHIEDAESRQTGRTGTVDLKSRQGEWTWRKGGGQGERMRWTGGDICMSMAVSAYIAAVACDHLSLLVVLLTDAAENVL